MRGEALKGHLELLLLAVLAEEPAHGYAVIDRLRERSGGTLALPEGTVYPALHRLEAEGRLSSTWVAHRGRRRRVYRLTEAGSAALQGKRDAWRSFSAAVTAVVGGAG
jgi:PadR family transcriptional regulator PadR